MTTLQQDIWKLIEGGVNTTGIITELLKSGYPDITWSDVKREIETLNRSNGNLQIVKRFEFNGQGYQCYIIN